MPFFIVGVALFIGCINELYWMGKRHQPYGEVVLPPSWVFRYSFFLLVAFLLMMVGVYRLGK